MKIYSLIVFLFICFALTACSGRSSKTMEQATIGDRHPQQKEEVVTYVENNKAFLSEVVKELSNWYDTYYYFARNGVQVRAEYRGWPYERTRIVDEKVLRIFEDQCIEAIYFPLKDELVVFNTGGLGNVTASISFGFYYSPHDKPVWVDSEQLKTLPFTTGEYLYYPMLQEGDGWIPDTSVLDAEKDDLLRGYGSYSERIFENFFYYESWY